jgi:pentatricopeptide repeat protein
MITTSNSSLSLSFSPSLLAGSSLAPPRTVEPPQNIDAAFVVFEDMKKSSFPVHESVFTAMIRCCSVHDKMKEALELYNDMKKIEIIPKIRTISPLLAGFSALGDRKVCFELFQDLVEVYELIPAEREYLSMLKVTVICRDVRFYTVLHQFMEDILVPSMCVWEVVKQWFLLCENGMEEKEGTSGR